MKKNTLIVLILFAVNNIFALDIPLSAGGGTIIGYTFTRYDLEGRAGGEKVNSSQSMDRIDYGAFVFLDAKYAELTIMFKGGYNSWEEDFTFGSQTFSDGSGTGTETSLGFSLMGKYPFTINEKFNWFPMLGIEYHFALTQRRQPKGDPVYDRTKGELVEDRDKNDNSYPISAWNSFWINVGAGTDYVLTDRLFLRGEFIFGFRLATGYEDGALEVLRKNYGVSSPKFSGLTGSPTLKIGVGYNIF